VDEAREPVGRTGRARGAPPGTGPPSRRKQPRATVAECLGEGNVCNSDLMLNKINKRK
jgi:hypothetical protein